MKKLGFTLIELIVLIIAVVMVFGLGFGLGAEKARARFKQEMVDKKVAHYETDNNGKVKCLWNTSDVVTVTNNVVE